MENFLKFLAGGIEALLTAEYGRRMGFGLIVFEFGEGENKPGDYISNAIRGDMVKALRETADRIERNEVIPPTIGSA